jgi:hypothetical protein
MLLLNRPFRVVLNVIIALMQGRTPQATIFHELYGHQTDEAFLGCNAMPFQPVSHYAISVCWVHRCKSCGSDSNLFMDADVVEGDEEEGTPWEGAVMFRRSATQSRFEYATTLERLGLARFSSEKAISVATDMGLTMPESDGVAGTPVQISVEVTKQGRDFQVDGVIRTALNLVCNR